MRFIVPPQTIAAYRFQSFPVYETSALTAVSIGVAAVGVGVGAYGAISSSEASSQAAASNAYVSRMTALAQGQSASYTDQLNYQSAMIQSQEQAANATILHNYSKTLDQEGTAQISALDQNQAAQQSAIRASYGASGVTADSGAPLQVAAYKAGNDQLVRMNTAYNMNQQALNENWQGTMQEYQSKLTAESAQQYQYAEQMAKWQEQAGIVGAGVTQTNAQNAANAQAIAGVGSAAAQAGEGFNSAVNLNQNLGGTFFGAIPANG